MSYEGRGDVNFNFINQGMSELSERESKYLAQTSFKAKCAKIIV